MRGVRRQLQGHNNNTLHHHNNCMAFSNFSTVMWGTVTAHRKGSRDGYITQLSVGQSVQYTVMPLSLDQCSLDFTPSPASLSRGLLLLLTGYTVCAGLLASQFVTGSLSAAHVRSLLLSRNLSRLLFSLGCKTRYFIGTTTTGSSLVHCKLQTTLVQPGLEPCRRSPNKNIELTFAKNLCGAGKGK